MLILTLVGLSFGMSEDSQRRQAGTGADLIILGSSGASVLSGHSATIPEELVPKLEQQPHIKAALGVMTHSIDLPLVAHRHRPQATSALSTADSTTSPAARFESPTMS